MAVISAYSESVEDISPSSITIDRKSGRSKMRWYLLSQDNGGEITVGDLQDAIGQILGYCASAEPGNFKLNRFLPLAHPFDPAMAAKSFDMKGLGRATKEVSFPTIEGNEMPNFALYDNYVFDIDFETKSYNIISDDNITVTDFTWNPPPPAEASPALGKYANEWIRYTDFDVRPQNTSITAVGGMSYFKTGDNLTPGGATVAQSSQFKGMPKMFMPNSVIIINWYEVPIRYIMSPKSFLNKFRGYVNQNDWFDGPSGKMFKAGELLYMSYTPHIYTSPVVQVMNMSSSVTYSKFCDLELQFLYTSRPLGKSAGANAPVTPLAANPNFIVAGHNLNPYFPLRQFYYTEFADTNGTKATYWFSFPFELLFTDPDSPGQSPLPVGL